MAGIGCHTMALGPYETALGWLGSENRKSSIRGFFDFNRLCTGHLDFKTTYVLYARKGYTTKRRDPTVRLHLESTCHYKTKHTTQSVHSDGVAESLFST